MKLSTGIRDALYKKLSLALMEKMSLSEFNEVFLFLDRCDGVLKIVPYGIFENEDNFTRLTKTSAGVVFGKWLDKATFNIEKDFNKSRKLVRVFKDILTLHQDSLAFNLTANNIFPVSLTSLFVAYDSESLPFKFHIRDEDSFTDSLNLLREYLAAIFFIDLVDDQLVVDRIISLFINAELENLIDEVIALGVIYNENWNK